MLLAALFQIPQVIIKSLGGVHAQNPNVRQRREHHHQMTLLDLHAFS